MNEETTKTVSFLKELIKDIENERISQNDLKKITEFYMNFLYDKTSIKEDWKKHLVLGWYIYEFLLQK